MRTLCYSMQTCMINWAAFDSATWMDGISIEIAINIVISWQFPPGKNCEIQQPKTLHRVGRSLLENTCRLSLIRWWLRISYSASFTDQATGGRKQFRVICFWRPYAAWSARFLLCRGTFLFTGHHRRSSVNVNVLLILNKGNIASSVKEVAADKLWESLPEIYFMRFYTSIVTKFYY